MIQAKQPTIDESVTAYLRTLTGANKSASTITAYRTDLACYVAFLQETNCTIASAADVTRVDVAEYLAQLSESPGPARNNPRRQPFELTGARLVRPGVTRHDARCKAPESAPARGRPLQPGRFPPLGCVASLPWSPFS
jgi:Phage integrase, N-terminal SAM-like domain